MIENYDILSENDESTVVARYKRPTVVTESTYQSEADLERRLIEQLKRQGYEYLPIHSEAELIKNLRAQLERLNNIVFSDGEWERFFKSEIAAEGKGIVDKAITIQKDHVKVLKRDDGMERNVYLIDKNDIHANSTQVINQYEANDGTRPNRYDVTILVNGLPLVHIELKRRGVSLKEAFNQINRYGRESFWAGCALYEYVQLFVISNGTNTKYYSNTTRAGHIKEQGPKKKRGKVRTSNSFEFTSYWTDAENQVLNELDDFTETFFSRHTLLNVLTRFCVLTEQNLLLAMRPYQIAATERLLNQIQIAHNMRLYGSTKGGGYVWHTTGSGKTLTSFKAAQLATRLPFIEKVMFVVDRKDLDYQTMKEYDRFQKGCANGNRSTKELTAQIGSSKSKIIITTIQKLSTFIKKNAVHYVYQKEVVMIFDECHRSQFGDMHKDIVKKFKKYYIFGFTGTPIFAENISGGGLLKTTEDVFGKRLHAYTIVDAIRDRNVLPFRVAYIRTMGKKEDVVDEKVWDIEREKPFMDARRITLVAQHVLENFDRQTKRNESYSLANKRLNGFNSIFAVQSIQAAKLYYLELKRQMEALPENRKLKIATIFSYAANEDVDGAGDEDNEKTDELDQSSRDFLEMAIEDYNKTFATNYDTSADKFQNYYKDISQRMKNREIDLLIVVNMFLTGFDATTLNTLWVDKNLKYHGLLQAFSRTNRILNSVKTFGNIVCFRNLEERTNRALALFGDRDSHSTTILRPFEDYMFGFTDERGKHVVGYVELVEALKGKFAVGRHPFGEKAEREFIALFGSILKMQNLLKCFEQFSAEVNPLSERELQEYESVYIDLHEKYGNQSRHDATEINDDIEFQMELVKQMEVNIDYILYLVQLYHDSHCTDQEIRVKIQKAIAASPDMRDKKELIERFLDNMNPDSDVEKAWREYVNACKCSEFESIIESENLKREKALKFIEMSFERGYVPEGGLALDEILPPINPFDKKANRQGKILAVLQKLKLFFNKYFEIASSMFTQPDILTRIGH